MSNLAMPNPRWIYSLILVIASLLLTGGIHAEESKSTAPTEAKSEPGAAPSATGLPTKPEELEATLRQRVERYWAARQSRDVRTVYELESAAQPGGWLKLEEAMSLQGLPVRKVKIEEVRIEGEKAKIKISAEVMVGTFGWTPQTTQDPWVLLNGQWFHETTR
ncbi:MAG: hypothetical protein JNJ76_00500 [Candidatus Competibacter sp.]|nr:hypothetical protein [Candidatus Competibacter sp.]